MKRYGLSYLLALAIVFSLFSFSYTSVRALESENVAFSGIEKTETSTEKAVALSAVPDNIKNLISDQTADKVFLNSDSDDDTELFTLRTENSETGEGTITVYSVPVKYVDSTGEMQFIDTSIKPLSAAESVNGDFAYRNSANSFTVAFANTASKGINFNNAFTLEADALTAGIGTGKIQTENGRGKIVYPDVFGPGTRVEYINTESGIKENIILEKHTGQNRFNFIFRSNTHKPLLTEKGMNILIADKDDTQKVEYRFLSLFAYDSYDPAKEEKQADSDFRHLNEMLYYELTDNGGGVYTITVVVPEDYLSHPETVYPVTIDPSLVYVSSNSNAQDTFVDAATPDTQSSSEFDYIRFGKVNGYKNFGYHRFNSLPAIPEGAHITSAYLKFTFRSGQTTPLASSGLSIRAYRITAYKWYESTITWNNQPSESWSMYTPIVYNGSYLDYFNANVTSTVRAWYNGGTANYGINFTYSNEEYNDYNSVVSSEGDAARAPALTMTYTLYGETSGITSGKTYYIKNAYSGKYLDAEQNLNHNVIQYTYHGNSNQQWRVVYQGDGLYRLDNHYSFYSQDRYSLGLAGLINNDINLWQPTTSYRVLFYILPNGDGTYRIQNYWPRGDEVLTVADGTSPSNVYNSAWYGSSYQKWVFEERSTKAVNAHTGELTVGMSVDNYGNSSSNKTCYYGFRVSTHTANGFWNGLSPLNTVSNVKLSFYNFNYGDNHSYTWATKNDFLSKHYYDIPSLNIDDVHFMLYIGHGLGKQLHFSEGSAGTSHSSDIFNHSVTDLNFSLSEARFGYGDAATKWVLLYTCNFINESSLANVKSMMNGCNIVMGYQGESYINEPQGTQIGKNLQAGKTVINSFFSTGSLHMQYGGDSTTARAVYVSDAYGDTIYTHLQSAGTYITEDVRMTYLTWS